MELEEKFSDGIRFLLDKVTNCLELRLQTQFVCQDRCLSRLACPVAPEHRYDPDQLNYHYTHSLAPLRRYYRR